MRVHPITVTCEQRGEVVAVHAYIADLVDIVLTAIGVTFGPYDEHIYMSTSCLHGNHGYCQSNTGLCGNKAPAQCKTCAARCICKCHSGGAQECK